MKEKSIDHLNIIRSESRFPVAHLALSLHGSDILHAVSGEAGKAITGVREDLIDNLYMIAVSLHYGIPVMHELALVTALQLKLVEHCEDGKHPTLRITSVFLKALAA